MHGSLCKQWHCNEIKSPSICCFLLSWYQGYIYIYKEKGDTLSFCPSFFFFKHFVLPFVHYTKNGKRLFMRLVK